MISNSSAVLSIKKHVHKLYIYKIPLRHVGIIAGLNTILNISCYQDVKMTDNEKVSAE